MRSNQKNLKAATTLLKDSASATTDPNTTKNHNNTQ